MYKRLTLSRIRVDLASPAYLVLGIIDMIILPINVLTSSRIRVELVAPAHLGLGMI